ncbi:hypothetical protein [Anaeroarcus burkinensis]|uniref:hypothetical protein n=1 Tax=Anaeroarcus burkinensis TaxID=82376 RepID=UPI0003F4EC47|nr:hypothetical protein [Anaeroarcus burkinensis]
MNNIAKKAVFLALAGIIQFGIGAATIEASPAHHDRDEMRQQDEQFEHDRQEREHRERMERERHERERAEQRRHEEAMRRHHHESEEAWQERQRLENERHEHEMNAIAAIVIAAVLK